MSKLSKETNDRLGRIMDRKGTNSLSNKEIRQAVAAVDDSGHLDAAEHKFVSELQAAFDDGKFHAWR